MTESGKNSLDLLRALYDASDSSMFELPEGTPPPVTLSGPVSLEQRVEDLEKRLAKLERKNTTKEVAAASVHTTAFNSFTIEERRQMRALVKVNKSHIAGCLSQNVYKWLAEDYVASSLCTRKGNDVTYLAFNFIRDYARHSRRPPRKQTEMKDPAVVETNERPVYVMPTSPLFDQSE